MTANEISYLVIGESIKIHSILGPGLLESVYEACLIQQLINAGLKVERQKAIPVIFQNQKMECGFRCDIMIEEKLIVEIKSVEGLNEIYTAQLLTYLRLSNIRLGLLINFNVVNLKQGLKRVINGY